MRGGASWGFGRYFVGQTRNWRAKEAQAEAAKHLMMEASITWKAVYKPREAPPA
jgi:hypothetical protein